MTWQAIDPSVLFQEDPAATLHWYRDDDAMRPGDLSVWIDGEGQVARFQLAYTPRLGAGELFASWERRGPLRTGEVESTRRASGYVRSPIVRRRRLTPIELTMLRHYVATNSELPSDQRDVIVAILGR